MFRKTWPQFGAEKTETHSERVRAFDLVGKPFTRALLLRGASGEDTGSQPLGQPRQLHQTDENRTFEEYATRYRASLAFEVTLWALGDLGETLILLTPNDDPKHMQMVVAYALLVSYSVGLHLKAEAVASDHKQATGFLMNGLLIQASEEERLVHFRRGQSACNSILHDPAPLAKDFVLLVSSSVHGYVLQWMTLDEKLRDFDFMRAFGAQLSMLWKSVD